MSSDTVTLETLRTQCDLSECDSCAENNCRIQLDGMSDRAIFKPDEVESDTPRADCCIFFPEGEEESNQLYRDAESSSRSSADFLAIIELKNTIEKPNHIKKQLEGAIDFAVELLQDCTDHPWNIRCLCLVVNRSSNTYNKSIRRKRIKKNVAGNLYIFRPVPINNGESLREVIEWREVNDTIREM